jgi:enamine deaminase RidA (YjgF/YER057c/UK114 family)
MSQAEEKLQQMGLKLPVPPSPAGSYVPAIRTGNLVFLSAAGPRVPDEPLMVGKVGRDLTAEQAQEAARITALNLLANLKAIIGDLDKVSHIVKVFGMVNCTPEFTDHPKVINGCSDLLVELFGEKGRHARAAVGVASVPFGSPVSIDMVVEVEG